MHQHLHINVVKTILRRALICGGSPVELLAGKGNLLQRFSHFYLHQGKQQDQVLLTTDGSSSSSRNLAKEH